MPIIEFNLIFTHWITAEALTFIFSWINKLKEKGRKIKVILPHPYPNIPGDYSLDEYYIKKRRKRLASLIFIWKIETACNLKIGQDIIVPSNYNDIFEEEKNKYSYIDLSWYNILPYQKVETSIFQDAENVRDHLDDKISSIYNIEENTINILNTFNSYTLKSV